MIDLLNDDKKHVIIAISYHWNKFNKNVKFVCSNSVEI